MRRATRPPGPAPPSPVQLPPSIGPTLYIDPSPSVRGTHKIEHRLFSYISRNWRGRSLVSYEVIINLIAATTTSTGLKVYARLDEQQYPKVEVSDEQLAAVNLVADAFHPEWNYTIKPSDN
ncbi:MAG: hypothetical protein H0W67_08275 [Gemmatimonadales bacterium]|nr:hypothetical protein [Gemmatimonadales bacterium]